MILIDLVTDLWLSSYSSSKSSILERNSDFDRGQNFPHENGEKVFRDFKRISDKSLYHICKTKYTMSPSGVRSEGGEAAAGYCLNSVSYRVDDAVKYSVLNSD